MVEGPGATKNSFKAKEFIHREILNVQCNCNNEVITKNGSDGKAWFNGRYLSQVFSIGKEIWLIFSQEKKNGSGTCEDDYALMIHFGMCGSLRLNKLNHDRSQSPNPNLCIGFGDSIRCKKFLDKEKNSEPNRIDIIETYQTSVHGPMKAIIPKKKYSKLTSLDVCSTNFKSSEVFTKIKSNPHSRVISDVILDQQIFPGVGNIIKVEALHESYINPKEIASTISDERLNTLILACRSYAMRWLHHGRAPAKKVYNQTICGTCRQPAIAMQRIGGTHRTTFWCTRCQPMRLEECKIFTDITNTSNICRTITPSTRTFRKVCSTHGPGSIIIRRVRKGINSNRIFFTCKVKDCNYFSWADTFFPQCKCKKRSTILISKTERTGGKWFFTCSNKTKRCGFFRWTDTTELERLGDKLHPLL